MYSSFFFFSSRRRHTRYWRDWSSDVCSSNLIVLGLTLAVVSLLGFSAMVGAVGGGGLGDLGIRYGYQRFMPEMMLAVVVVLIVLVQAVQSIGDRLARRLNKRIRHA